MTQFPGTKFDDRIAARRALETIANDPRSPAQSAAQRVQRLFNSSTVEVAALVAIANNVVTPPHEREVIVLMLAIVAGYITPPPGAA